LRTGPTASDRSTVQLKILGSADDRHVDAMVDHHAEHLLAVAEPGG
jgi:hypothetical protein